MRFAADMPAQTQSRCIYLGMGRFQLGGDTEGHQYYSARELQLSVRPRRQTQRYARRLRERDTQEAAHSAIGHAQEDPFVKLNTVER